MKAVGNVIWTNSKSLYIALITSLAEVMKLPLNKTLHFSNSKEFYFHGLKNPLDYLELWKGEYVLTNVSDWFFARQGTLTFFF